jgi:predicted secreted protein
VVKIGTTALGALKSGTLTMNEKAIDISSASDAGYAAFLPGRREWKLESDGLFVYSDLGKKLLWTNWVQSMASGVPALLTVHFLTPDGNDYTGSAVLTELQFKGSYDDAMTAKVTLQGSGTLTPTTS